MKGLTDEQIALFEAEMDKVARLEDESAELYRQGDPVGSLRLRDQALYTENRARQMRREWRGISID